MKSLEVRVFLVGLVVCCSSLLCSGSAFAAFFPLEDVKPGLEGYAITAGAGNVLSRFSVKVESVVQEGMDSPRILIRASGSFIESTGGIAAGMSGSPVYFKNQLAGAISAGFPNADHNLGLVTPIEIMTKAAPTPVTGLMSESWRNQVSTSVTRMLEYYGLGPDFSFLNPRGFNPLGRSVPLAAPLTLQGISGRAGTKLLEDFRAKGVNMTALPVQAGPVQAGPVQSSAAGTAKAVDRPYKLEAGAPISVQLISGDFMVGAVGTVTLVEGKNILAFGHPFLNDARARYAAAPAYVNAIIPASDIPFKLAESINKPFGAITTDRPYAVGGTLGADPQLLPLEITVRGQTSSSIIMAPVPNRTFKLGLAPVEAFTGALAYASALSALDATLEGAQPGSATISLAMTFADKTITFKDRIADENDISTLTAQRAAGAVALVAENPFKAPGLQRLKLTLELAPYNLMRLVKAEPETKKVKPGQTVGVNLRLQPWRAPVVVRRISVKIPSDASEGEYILKVRGGLTPRPDSPNSSNDPWDGLLGFDDLLERLRNRISGDNVLIETNEDEPSILEVEAVGVPVSGLLSVKFTVIGNKP